MSTANQQAPPSLRRRGVVALVRAAGLGLLVGATAAFAAAWLRPRRFAGADYAAPRPAPDVVDVRSTASDAARVPVPARSGGR